MWQGGVHLGVKATTAELIVGNRNGVWLTRNVRRNQPTRDRIEAIWKWSWLSRGAKNEDDPKMDGTRLKETEERVSVPQRVYISRENLEEFGFSARCQGCTSLLRGTARQAHKGTAKADAAMRRMKEHQDRAAAKGTKRMKISQEDVHQ